MLIKDWYKNTDDNFNFFHETLKLVMPHINCKDGSCTKLRTKGSNFSAIKISLVKRFSVHVLVEIKLICTNLQVQIISEFMNLPLINLAL